MRTGNKICPKCKGPSQRERKNKINKKRKKVMKLVIKKDSAVPKKLTAHRNTTHRQLTLQIGPHHIKNALARLQTSRFGSTVEEIANEIKREVPGLSRSEVAMDVERKMKCAIEAGIAEVCGQNGMYRLRRVAPRVDKNSTITEAAKFWECCGRTGALETCRDKRLRDTYFDPLAGFNDDHPIKKRLE